jgi:zinc protease
VDLRRTHGETAGRGLCSVTTELDRRSVARIWAGVTAANGIALLIATGACAGTPRRPDPAAGLPPADRSISMKVPVRGVLAEGGFRVLVAPDPSVDLVELAVRIPIGAAADPPGKEGLAHLVEHLALQARTAPGADTIERRLAAIATSFNASARTDATHYVATATVAEADRVAEVLADLATGVRCAQIERSALELERAVVQAERRLRQDGDDERLAGALHAVGYPAGHPYRRPLATAASLAAITWDDVCGFLAEHYRPERSFAVVVGGGSIERERAILAPFDRVAAGAAPPMAAVAPAKVDPTPVEVALSSGVDRLYLVWAAPARHDEAGLIARMVATRLGSELAAEHRAGRLGEVAINFVGGTAAPLLVVGVELDGASPAAVRAAVGAALGRLWRVGGDDEAYFLRVVALHGLFGALTAFHGRTEIWADYLQHDASMGLFSSDTERLGGFTRAALAQTTAEVFAIERAGEVVVRAGAAPGPSEATAVGAAPVEPRAVTPLPSAMPPLPRDRGQVRITVLPGGVTVVMVPSGQVPMVTARLVVPAGTRDDQLGGEAWLAAHTVTAVERHGRYRNSGRMVGTHLIRLKVAVAPTTTTFTATTLTPLQDHLLWGLIALVRDGISDNEVVARQAKRWRAWDRSSQRRLLAAAIATARHGSATAHGPPVTPASLAQLDAGALDAWRAERYARAGAILVLTGDFSWSLMERHLPTVFAGWGGTSRPAPLPGPTRSTWITFTRDDPQVAIELRLPVSRGDARGEAAARLTAALLEEQIAAVRTSLGAAYALHAVFDDDPEGLAVVIGGEIDGAQAGPAAAIIARAVAAARAGTATSAQLEGARARALRHLADRLGAGDAAAADAIGWLRRDLTPGHGVEVAAALAAVPADQLAAAVAGAVGPHTIAIVGGRAPAVAATLAAFGARPDVAIGGDDPE